MALWKIILRCITPVQIFRATEFDQEDPLLTRSSAIVGRWKSIEVLQDLLKGLSSLSLRRRGVLERLRQVFEITISGINKEQSTVLKKATSTAPHQRQISIPGLQYPTHPLISEFLASNDTSSKHVAEDSRGAFRGIAEAREIAHDVQKIIAGACVAEALGTGQRARVKITKVGGQEREKRQGGVATHVKLRKQSVAMRSPRRKRGSPSEEDKSAAKAMKPAPALKSSEVIIVVDD